MQTNLTELLKGKGLRLIDLARLLDVNRCLPTRWAQTKVPPTRVVDIEKVTGIPREKLRPDIFGSR